MLHQILLHTTQSSKKNSSPVDKLHISHNSKKYVFVKCILSPGVSRQCRLMQLYFLTLKSSQEIKISNPSKDEPFFLFQDYIYLIYVIRLSSVPSIKRNVFKESIG